MQALVLEKKGELSLREIALPLDVGPDDVRIAIHTVGVCGSDVHYYTHGAIGSYVVRAPMVLGHEAAGIVQDVGAGVTSVKPGDHIIFSFRTHCGRCLYCTTGRTVLCDGYTSARWAMLDGTNRLSLKGKPVNQMARLGTFSETVVCAAEMVVPIRNDMPWPQQFDGKYWKNDISTRFSINADRKSVV